MILVDVNLLVYAHVRVGQHHKAARDWLDDQLNGVALVGLPWHSLLGFLRVSTNPRMTAPPVTMSNALAQMEAWLALDNVWVPQPTDRHASILAHILRTSNARGKRVSDAHLAALAIEHGLTLCSADGDFARFQGLRWVNPIVP